MPQIQVTDVAASVQRALDFGGRELMHATDTDGGSQWAVLRDPNDAAFGVVPVVPSDLIPQGDRAASADGSSAIGRIAWLDLTVADASATRDFYREVVGWSVDGVEMEDAGERYSDYNSSARTEPPWPGSAMRTA